MTVDRLTGCSAISSLDELHSGARLSVIGAPWRQSAHSFQLCGVVRGVKARKLPWPRIALGHEELRSGPNRSAHKPASARSPHYGSGCLVRVFHDIAHRVSSLPPWALTNC